MSETIAAGDVVRVKGQPLSPRYTVDRIETSSGGGDRLARVTRFYTFNILAMTLLGREQDVFSVGCLEKVGPENPDELKVGDKVRLVSGGRRMTVTGVRGSDVGVAYDTDSGMVRSNFDAAALVRPDN